MKLVKSSLLFIVFTASLLSQNITTTLGPLGVFTIKDASANFFTLSQSTGQVNILNTLRLENTTNATTGVIFKGADRFIHNYGTSNTFMGKNSGNFTMTGAYNTALGSSSLYSNTTGDYNTAVGMSSLFNNTAGHSNTAIGFQSLSGNTTGSNNIAIGNLAQVPSGTASNQIRMGNTTVTYAGIQVPWTITSDRRWKSDIQNTGLGLEFITKLRPVSYFRNNDESKKTEYGFVAQEVEEVLKEEGATNSGMLTITDDGMYELRYNDLLAPMVKAIQELNDENKKLSAGLLAEKNQSEKLQVKNEDLEERLTKYEQMQIKLVEKIEQMEIKRELLKHVQQDEEVKLGEK